MKTDIFLWALLQQDQQVLQRESSASLVKGTVYPIVNLYMQHSIMKAFSTPAFQNAIDAGLSSNYTSKEQHRSHLNSYC